MDFPTLWRTKSILRCMAGRNIIVVGASAGGVSALKQLLSRLPQELPAAVCITMHMFNRADSSLAAILDRAGPLSARFPSDGDSLEHGCVYVAPPDYHLILHGGRIQLQHGPRENLQRPCINVMFRSAALAYKERVVGVVLTGLLDDGAAGLWEIQQHGGGTIVQDPEEASYRSMPDSAIAGLNVEYILPLHEISSVLTRLSMKGQFPVQVPSESATSEPSQQACPECGGVMKAVNYGRLREYKCHVGHRLGAKTMISQKSEVIERSLWNAVSQLEELIDLLQRENPEKAPSEEALDSEIRQRREEIKSLRRILRAEPTSPLLS
jgi:two-component system, chemotaxis family, protein-glutamate methylesterase/glutaminase